MHTGNLSFRPQGRLVLAPAYDMQPMLYAQLPGGEVPMRSFEPTLPLPPQRPIWTVACAVAVRLWTAASQDQRVSDGFRRVCASNAQRLLRLTEQV